MENQQIDSKIHRHIVNNKDKEIQRLKDELEELRKSRRKFYRVKEREFERIKFETMDKYCRKDATRYKWICTEIVLDCEKQLIGKSESSEEWIFLNKMIKKYRGQATENIDKLVDLQKDVEYLRKELNLQKGQFCYIIQTERGLKENDVRYFFEMLERNKELNQRL